MYATHGEYPLSDWGGVFTPICRLQWENAAELIENAIAQCGRKHVRDRFTLDFSSDYRKALVDAPFDMMLNKGFRIVLVRHAIALAVYNHDGNWSLLMAPYDRLCAEQKKRSSCEEFDPPFPRHS